MPFDGILTHFMAEELNNRLSGGRIGKIQQIKRDTIILHIRPAGRTTGCLYPVMLPHPVYI